MKLLQNDVNEFYLLDETKDEIVSSGDFETVADVLSNILAKTLTDGGIDQDTAKNMANSEVELALEIMAKQLKSTAVFGRHSFIFAE